MPYVTDKTTITVRHNFEAAHRLFLTPGKCEKIHGHSFWVDFTLHGSVDSAGMLDGLDFGDVKKKFRSFLDENFDHRTLLNKDDPWAGAVWLTNPNDTDNIGHPVLLPGLFQTEGDPTTENITYWIATWGLQNFPWSVSHVEVVVHETTVNSATCRLARNL
jgi:6-pyruvoyltetrahydropterin/6-carboxytetrahydropterin synthase